MLSQNLNFEIKQKVGFNFEPRKRESQHLGRVNEKAHFVVFFENANFGNFEFRILGGR
jgi:hypothetical protein